MTDEEIKTILDKKRPTIKQLKEVIETLRTQNISLITTLNALRRNNKVKESELNLWQSRNHELANMLYRSNKIKNAIIVVLIFIIIVLTLQFLF